MSRARHPARSLSVCQPQPSLTVPAVEAYDAFTLTVWTNCFSDAAFMFGEYDRNGWVLQSDGTVHTMRKEVNQHWEVTSQWNPERTFICGFTFILT